MTTELEKKEKKVWTFLEKQKADGLLLSMRDNFAWISCGGISGVDKCVQNGVVDVLLINGEKYLLASTIEKFRFMQEEVEGKGFKLVDYKWHEGKEAALASIVNGRKIISDSSEPNTICMYKEIQKLRYSLEKEEIERLIEVSKVTSQAMGNVCRGIRSGDTEWNIAANLNEELMKNGFEVPVCLVAADDRIKNFRHPVPKGKKVEKMVLVGVGAEKYGIVVSISRVVHLGQPDKVLLDKHKACITVDATFIHNTVVGANVSNIFKAGIEAYSKCGYPDEWELHHQGGSAGYRSRDYIADFNCNEVVQLNQMFSWNPSITGTKSEDTILVTSEGPKVTTEIDGWPLVDICIEDKVYKRPDILVI